MPVAKTAKSTAAEPELPRWTPEQLLKVRHLGPSLIGQAMYDAAQAYVSTTHGGRFGPALLGDPAHSQAGPVAIKDGKPVFAAS